MLLRAARRRLPYWMEPCSYSSRTKVKVKVLELSALAGPSSCFVLKGFHQPASLIRTIEEEGPDGGPAFGKLLPSAAIVL